VRAPRQMIVYQLPHTRLQPLRACLVCVSAQPVSHTRARPELARLATCKATVIGSCTFAAGRGARLFGCLTLRLCRMFFHCHALLPACGGPGSADTADLLARLEPGYGVAFACTEPGPRGRAGNQTCNPCIPRAWFDPMWATKQAISDPLP
jgi:hypothetical protein